jgi:PAS domain S-box-containing protein
MLLILLIVGVPFVFVRKLASTWLILGHCGVAGLTLYFVRRGRAQLAGWILLIGGWIGVTIHAWLAGGIGSIDPVLYVAMSAGAGWLFGVRAVILNGCMSSAALGAMVAVDIAGPRVPQYFPVPPLAALMLFGLALIVTSIPFQQVLQSLDEVKTENENHLRKLQFTEGALQMSEARHRALFNLMTEAIFVADAETGMILDANPAAEALVGRSLEEIRTLHQTQLHPSDTKERARWSFAEHIGNPGMTIAEEAAHRDGRRIPVEITAAVWTDTNGKTLVFGVFRDVTERRNAEQALRTSEERFRKVAESAGEFIWEIDATGLIVYASQASEKLLGYAPNEIMGKLYFYDLFSPDNREELKKAAFDAFALRQPFRNFIHSNVKKDGRTVILETSGMPLLDEKGDLIGYCGADADVTERNRAEAELWESKARLSEAARIAGLGYSIFDVQTNMTTWSDEMYQLVGLDSAQAPPSGDEGATLYAPESWVRLEEATRHALTAGEPFELDLDMLRRDGTVRHTHVRSAVGRDERGQVLRLYTTVQDITERKIAEERLRRMQWAEGFRLMSRGIAHDFNNLLGAILAEVEVILMDAPPDMTGWDELRKIEGLSHRASEIVRQLMIYSGQEQPSIGPVDLSALVDEILELLKRSVGRNAALIAELARDLPPVMGDCTQLRQVIMNLVINASEALGTEEGVIRVSTRLVTVREDTESPQGNYVQLEVSDTGCGMNEETRARIFNPFFSTKAEGRGLGLATVQSIVRQIGGVIEVFSVPSRGSRFEVLLPCADSVVLSTELAPSKPVAQKISVPVTVLVVEDEHELRQATSKMLSKNGFTVLQAADGAIAMDLLRSVNRIDAVLLDVTIPGCSSSDVAFSLQDLQPRAKVILTSAYGSDLVMGSFKRAQISEFIRKPYRLAELLEALQRALSS